MRNITVKIITLIAAAAALLASSGCAEKYEKMNEIRRAVRDYNDALAKCQAILDVEPLRGFATQAEIDRNSSIVDKLKLDKTTMSAEIKEFVFEDIDVKGKDFRTARTREIWLVSKTSTKTGEIVQQPTTITYRLDYTLKLEGGKWLVDRVRLVEPQK